MSPKVIGFQDDLSSIKLDHENKIQKRVLALVGSIHVRCAEAFDYVLNEQPRQTKRSANY